MTLWSCEHSLLRVKLVWSMVKTVRHYTAMGKGGRREKEEGNVNNTSLKIDKGRREKAIVLKENTNLQTGNNTLAILTAT